MANKVICPQCGNKYRLKETCYFEVSEDGTYDWAKPIYTECNMACTECGYEPCFDNHVGRVEIHEGEVHDD